MFFFKKKIESIRFFHYHSFFRD